MPPRDSVPKTVAEYVQWLASRGGKARAKAMTPAERSASARESALARWKKTTREERRASARKAAQARWRKRTE
jgi:hypothetical protein